MPDNEFGYTPWGRDWVRLAEPIGQTKPDPNLPRARSIARNNGVSTDIDGRTIRANVHRGGQASIVFLEVAAMPPTTATTVAELLPTDNRTLDDDLHRTLRADGISTTPVLAGVDCSCTARSPRCVHLLAACYHVSRLVDENPHLTLQLQGFTRETAKLEETQWIPLHQLNPTRWFTTT